MLQKYEMITTDSFLRVMLRKLCLAIIMIYGDHLMKVCYRLVMKYLDIENRICNVNMWWWNSGVRNVIEMNKKPYKVMIKILIE